MSATADELPDAAAENDALELQALARGVRAHLERRAWLGTQKLERSATRAPEPSERVVAITPQREPRPSAGAPGAAEEEPRGESLWEGMETTRTTRSLGDPGDPGAAHAPRQRSAFQPSSGSTPGPASVPAVPVVPAATAAVAAAAGDLAALAEAVRACTACALCKTRKQTVFADGSGKARVMFIGEAPGHDEDQQGVPFVGRAGQLLTDIITKGMGLAREDVYIANVLKCRPPDNRDPEPEEKRLCTPFLDRQIELLDPELILTLGRHASQHLLESTESMGRLRGRIHVSRGRKVIATYHPAYLLRSPGMKKECWKDVQLAMKELGLERPGGGA